MNKAYKAAFPNGPQPIATFPNTPEGLAAAREAIGAEAVKRAFKPGGRGLEEIVENCGKFASQIEEPRSGDEVDASAD